MQLAELVIIALVLFIVFGFFYLGVRKFFQTKTQKNAEQIFNQKFNGSSTTTYRHHVASGLRFDQVLQGAEKRGYKLQTQHKDSKKVTTLVFKRAA